MEYFKIIQNSHVVEASTSLVKIDEKYHMLLYSDIDHAQFVQARNGGKLYHDSWLRPVRDSGMAYETAEIIMIEEAEYEEIVAMLDDDETIPVIGEAVEQPEEPAETEEITVDEKPMSISEMRGKIKELEELVAKLTSVIGTDTGRVD